MIFRHEFQVPPEAVDANGHVNNVEYVRWMQDAAVRHSDSVGCTAATHAHGATWVIRSHRVDYLRPAFGGDRIAVLTWVVSVRKVRSLRKYRFLRARDAAVLAEGETDWVLVDAQTGRPRAIPAAIMAGFVIGEPRGAAG